MSKERSKNLWQMVRQKASFSAAPSFRLFTPVCSDRIESFTDFCSCKLHCVRTHTMQLDVFARVRFWAFISFSSWAYFRFLPTFILFFVTRLPNVSSMSAFFSDPGTPIEFHNCDETFCFVSLNVEPLVPYFLSAEPLVIFEFHCFFSSYQQWD